MTRIESEKLSINNSSEVVYSLLSNFNNFQKLMPEQVIDWESTSDECSFTIKGLTNLSMKITERLPNSKVIIKDKMGKPFNFFLNCLIEEDPQSKSCKAQLVFDADLNPMLKMMAVKPLQNFLNLLVKKLKEICERN